MAAWKTVQAPAPNFLFNHDSTPGVIASLLVVIITSFLPDQSQYPFP